VKYIRTSIVTGLVMGGGLLAAPTAQAAIPADSTPCTHRLVSAHEGYALHADGDTVASQKAAYNIGSNIADSDLWVTKDGYIVEMHDNDVSFSTNGTGLVTQMTLAQVLALRTKFHDNRIPQLSNSLSIRVAHDPGRYLMFETKFSFAKTANLQLLDNEIQAAGMTAHVIVYSSYLSQVQYLKQIDPALTVWYKADSVPDVSTVQGLNGVMIPAADITAAVVDSFHAAGQTVTRERPTTEDAAAWTHFVKTGADALMTSDPPTVIAECRALP
jgi:glycerophosphoryl diester phosphodiesterase